MVEASLTEISFEFSGLLETNSNLSGFVILSPTSCVTDQDVTAVLARGFRKTSTTTFFFLGLDFSGSLAFVSTWGVSASLTSRF